MIHQGCVLTLRGQMWLHTSYLFISQCGRGFEGRCRTQAAQGPGFADFGRLQGPAVDRTEAAQVGQVGGGADHAQGLALHGLCGTNQRNKKIRKNRGRRPAALELQAVQYSIIHN